MLSAFTKFYSSYSSADNLVGLIYKNLRAIGFKQISGHLDNTVRNITKKTSSGPGPLSQASSKVGKFRPQSGLTAKPAWLPAEKLNIQACWQYHYRFRSS